MHVLRAARARVDRSRRGSGIAPGCWSSHPLCGCEKCVYVLIVLVDAGGGVDAGDAGLRAGVVAVRVGGVVAGVSVVSRELAPWSRWGRAGSTWLPYIPSPHELDELGGVEPFRPQRAGSIKCPAALRGVGAIQGPSSLRAENQVSSRPSAGARLQDSGLTECLLVAPLNRRLRHVPNVRLEQKCILEHQKMARTTESSRRPTISMTKRQPSCAGIAEELNAHESSRAGRSWRSTRQRVGPKRDIRAVREPQSSPFIGSVPALQGVSHISWCQPGGHSFAVPQA